MAYSELIKNFSRVRAYLREFYIYGFRSREEFTAKSARTYDDERRHVESWLGDHMRFDRSPDGKRVFLSIDSRRTQHDPFYKAWKAKSFTDGDITLHFLLFDILSSPDIALTLAEITERLDAYEGARLFDASTVRKKLGEYAAEGLILTEKRGKTMLYRRAADTPLPDDDILDFFSETAPCGVIGSFLLDKTEPHEGHFIFKHHYLTAAADSEIVCALLTAMEEHRRCLIRTEQRGTGKPSECTGVPLRLFVSAQSGRQYIMVYRVRDRRIASIRTDNIVSVTPGEVCEDFAAYREKLDGMMPHLWGASAQSKSGERMEHVDFTVTYASDEEYIHRRLEREARCGTVERIDAHTSRFSADVYDASELLPWIRTYLCRITELHISNPVLDERFRRDLHTMYALYGLEGGEKA